MIASAELMVLECGGCCGGGDVGGGEGDGANGLAS
jgi:hypothetical protein